jgi:hypothetical protein
MAYQIVQHDHVTPSQWMAGGNEYGALVLRDHRTDFEG